MTTRPARVVLYGLGAMGRLAAGICIQRGIEIVGAIARSPDKVGVDLGTLLGLPEQYGVTVSDDAEAVLGESEADVALIAIASRLSIVEPHIRRCADAGVDVLTLEEEAVFPWWMSPEVAHRVDALAKEQGITVAATGLQDTFWVDLPRALMSAAQHVVAVRGQTSWNSDDYGPEVEASLLIGCDPDDPTVRQRLESMDRRSVTAALHALAATHDLHVIDRAYEIAPVVADRDVRSPVTGRVVLAGQIRGISNAVTLRTAEGIELSLVMRGFLHGEGENCINNWQLVGEPALSVVVEPFPGRLVTCTALINRIPDVIAADAGLISADRLPPMKYRPGTITVPVTEHLAAT